MSTPSPATAQPASPAYEIQTITSTEAIAELAPDWRRATRGTYHDAPFFQPEWCAATATSFFPGSAPNILTVRSSGELVGVLPLLRSRGLRRGVPLRTLRSISSPHSCRSDLIVGAAPRAEVARAAWSALRQDPWWQAIAIDDVPEDGALHSLLELAKADSCLTAKWRSRLSPTLAVDPSAPFALCPKRYKSFRNRLKGKLQRLSEKGTVEFKVESSPTAETLDRFFALEGAGWKGARHSAVASCESTLRFYQETWGAAAALGYARVYTLLLAGKPIAMHLGLCMSGIYCTPKVAYDENYRDYSLGHLLMQHAIQDLPNVGAHRFDFLGPNALWKSVWSTTLQRHDTCYVFRPTLAGRAAHAGLTQIAMRMRAVRHRLKGDPQDPESWQ